MLARLPRRVTHAIHPLVAWSAPPCGRRHLASATRHTTTGHDTSSDDRLAVYAPTAVVTHTIPQFVAEFSHLSAGARLSDVRVSVGGRVVSKRQASGKLVFYTLRADGCDVQVMATLAGWAAADTADTASSSEPHLSPKAAFKVANAAVRRGDVVVVTGVPASSNKGQLSVVPSSIAVVATCQHDIPPEHYGLANPDLRYRRRYLDLIANASSHDVFVRRSVAIAAIRRFFADRGFLEVETPSLSPSAGGAAARPFRTHARAVGADLQLRIAPELFLKQCVVGGMHRVFELGKVFRNEGVTPHHNPEFTTCEFYQAFANLDDLMATTEALLADVCTAVNASTKAAVPIGDDVVEVDFAGPYPRRDVVPSLEAILGVHPLPTGATADDAAQLIDIMEARGIELPPLPHTAARLLDALICHCLEPLCEQPTFLCGHPVALSPLAHRNPADPNKTLRFELFVAGKEVANAYVELNDPAEQRTRFAQQAQDKALGDPEAQAMDEAFCTSLEYGLPPTGGWGLGVDRLVMMLTGQTSIKDVLLYPVLKPVGGGSGSGSNSD